MMAPPQFGDRMAYQDQQQRPTTNKLQLSDEQAAAIAQLTTREGWLEFSVDDIKLIAEDFPPCPPTAMLDFKKFVYLMSQKGLNPILGDAHFEFHGDKRSSTGVKGVAVIHQQAELKIASRTGLLDGINQEDGTDERGLYVITRVYKKGAAHPYYFKAYHNEFVQSNGFLWPKSPYNMTAKCSRVGCLRIAFPELSGLVGEAEVDDGFSFSEPSLASTPATSIKIGEKPALAPVSTPTPEAPATSGSRRSEPEPVKLETPSAAPTVATTQSPVAKPTPAQAITTAAPAASTEAKDQYKARLAMLTGKDSNYAKLGLTKSHIDQFLMGWFGAETKAKLGTFSPEQFPPTLDTLMVALAADSETIKILLEDPISCGFSMRPAPASSRVDEIKAFFNWAEPLAGITDRLLSKEGITDLDVFKKMIDAQMPKFTEPQLEIALAIGYYSPDALAALLKCHFATKMPLSFFMAEIEKQVGGDLLTLECDPVKVSDAIVAVIKSMEKK